MQTQVQKFLLSIVLCALVVALDAGPQASAQSQPVATISVGDQPRAVVFSPDSSVAYVSHSAEATIRVVRTADHTVIDTITLGPTEPGYNLSGLDVTPDGEYLYVTWRARGAVVPVRTSDGAVLPEIPVCIRPLSVKVTPDGNRAYVACFEELVMVLDTTTNTVVDQISFPSSSMIYAIDISPDGSKAYVNDNLTIKVYVISTADNSFVDTINISFGRPHHDIAVSPDGTYVYTTATQNGAVAAIRPFDHQVRRIDVGGGPSGIAVTPDGGYVYVSSMYTNRVSVIRTADNAVLEHIPVGRKPDGIIDISPDGHWLYVPNRDSNTVSVISVLTGTKYSAHLPLILR